MTAGRPQEIAQWVGHGEVVTKRCLQEEAEATCVCRRHVSKDRLWEDEDGWWESRDRRNGAGVRRWEAESDDRRRKGIELRSP